MEFPRLAAAFLAALLFAPAAGAYVGCESLPESNQRVRARAPIAEAFAARKFVEVERYFSRILADLAAGKVSDADASFDFDLFLSDRPAREPLHAGWIKAYPKSEAAHLAQAWYFAARGWESRGTEFASKTSESQFAAMRDWFRRAMRSLDDAERLSKHPTLEWAKRMDMLRTVGDRDGAASLYRQAIDRYPSTVMVRVAYAEARARRWGGSTRDVLNVVEDAKGLPEGDRRFVEARAQYELALDANACENPQAAVAHFERMVALCPAFVTSARCSVNFYAKNRDVAKVLDFSNKVIAQAPTDGEAYAGRAWAYGNSGRMNEAFADFRRSAELGYARSYLDLAGFYQMGIGGAPRDLRKALELCNAAYDKGVPEGKECADRVRGLIQRNP